MLLIKYYHVHGDNLQPRFEYVLFQGLEKLLAALHLCILLKQETRLFSMLL